MWKRNLASIAAVAVALILAYLFWIEQQIKRQSTIDEARPADVIIVLGAAEYRGEPSPVLQARLNHALVLYLKGLARYIMTTGGAGGDPVFTEGEVGRAYLTKPGVPPEAILVEPEGSSTAQSITIAVEIMQRMNLHTAIMVSDGYHIFRGKRMLERRGVTVFGSPRPTEKTEGSGLDRLYWRQTIGYVLWRIGVNM